MAARRPVPGSELLQSRLIDDYVARVVRRELLMIHCAADHPVVGVEDRLLAESLKKLQALVAARFPNGAPTAFRQVLSERMAALAAARMSTYDDVDEDDRAEALRKLLERGFPT